MPAQSRRALTEPQPASTRTNGADEEAPGVGAAGGSNSENQEEMRGGGDLPEDLQAGIESLSGVSMAGVKVHRGASDAADVGARAYAQGDEIHLGPGADDALAHEAWHVAQQRQGRVDADDKVGDNGMNADAGLEAEADVMGARAAALGASAPAGPVAAGKAPGAGAPIQRDRAVDLDEGLNLAKGVSQMYSDAVTAVPTKLVSAASGLKDSKTKAISSLATVVAGANPKILTTRRGEVQGLAESVFALESTHLETRDGGHSLERHGPGVSDDALKTRLRTGVAPDGKLSPTTGLSTKFASHEAYLKSREKAVQNLQAAFGATKDALKTELQTFQKLRVTYEKKNKELQDDNTDTRKDKVQPMKDAKKAWDDQAAVVKGVVDGIGQDNNAGLCPVKFNAKAALPKDYVTLYGGYDVVVDNGTAIGKGFKGTDASKGTAQPDPNKDAFDTWSASTEEAGLQITRTGIECPSKTEPLFGGTLAPASWKVYQHFPVQETPGIKA